MEHFPSLKLRKGHHSTLTHLSLHSLNTILYTTGLIHAPHCRCREEKHTKMKLTIDWFAAGAGCWAVHSFHVQAPTGEEFHPRGSCPCTVLTPPLTYKLQHISTAKTATNKCWKLKLCDLKCKESYTVCVRYVTSHPGQLSLAIPSRVGAMSTSQRAVMPCGWGVKAGMVRVWEAGKTVWSPCYTRAISERFRDKELIIKRYKKLAFFTLLYCNDLTPIPLNKKITHFNIVCV